MNKTLKFSFGHIIAFIAIIFIGYLSFIGLVYLNDGNFKIALVETAAVVVVLFAICLGIQLLKATESKFSRRIKIERTLLIIAPIIYVAAMIPYMHFWTINSHNDELVKEFTDAITLSKQMFTDYDTYTDRRLSEYSNHLDQTISLRSANPAAFAAAGFTSDRLLEAQKQNMMRTLQLQLRSSNYDSLKTLANTWIENADQGASSWNVFLLGNTKQIEQAINDWEANLTSWAESRLSNEPQNSAALFGDSGSSAARANASLAKMHHRYNSLAAPSIVAILSVILLYGLIMLPWVLQDRHTRSMYTLTGNKFVKDGFDFSASDQDDTTKDVTPDIAPEQPAEENSDNNKVDKNSGFGSFTLD